MKAINFNYRVKISLLLVGGLVLLAIFTFLTCKVNGLINKVFVVKKGIQYHTLIENVELDGQWEEIDLTGVNFPRKEINYITIKVNSPYYITHGENESGIKAPNGEVFLPRVSVEDREGKRCVLEYSGGIGEHIIQFSDRAKIGCFSEPGKYKKLFVKSPVKFTAKSILWAGFNLKDMK